MRYLFLLFVLPAVVHAATIGDTCQRADLQGAEPQTVFYRNGEQPAGHRRVFQCAVVRPAPDGSGVFLVKIPGQTDHTEATRDLAIAWAGAQPAQ